MSKERKRKSDTYKAAFREAQLRVARGGGVVRGWDVFHSDDSNRGDRDGAQAEVNRRHQQKLRDARNNSL